MTTLLKIPQCDPHAEVIALREDIDAAIRAVLDSGEYILGSAVSSFEAEFAEYIGVRYGVGVASGTDAIHLALRALGIQPGDEVVAPSHTAVATIVGIEMAGAHPVLADVEEESFNLDPASVEMAITPKTKAIVAVHLYGQPARLDDLLAIAARHGIPLVEDCAQAHGALYRDRKVGSYGAAACFSFYPTKNLGAIGDGGMVVTQDPKVFGKLSELRQYGWRQRYSSESKGFNSRLDEIQAAILRVKLKNLDDSNQLRRSLAGRYSEGLSGSVGHLPTQGSGTTPVYHLYVIRHPRRDALREWLHQRGISTGIHYPYPVHLQPAYAGIARDQTSLAVTERISKQILSLPLYPQMNHDQVDAVVEAIREFDALGV